MTNTVIHAVCGSGLSSLLPAQMRGYCGCLVDEWRETVYIRSQERIMSLWPQNPGLAAVGTVSALSRIRDKCKPVMSKNILSQKATRNSDIIRLCARII